VRPVNAPQRNCAASTQSASHETLQHCGSSKQTSWQQPDSLQYGVLWTSKQFPVPEPPQTAPSLHGHAGLDLAASTQTESQAAEQQNGSESQTDRQQASFEQLGVPCGVQQSGSDASPHGATGQASL
jgi:hypothetical protein